MGCDTAWMAGLIREVPDFPTPGVRYRDITPLLGHVDGFRLAIDCLADHFAGDVIDLVAGIEARGFIIGSPVAYRFGAGFVPVRKAGKLPHDTHAQTYELEYGTDALEAHRDAILPGQNVLIVDDVLATGGTAAATAALVEAMGGTVMGLAFLVELPALAGRSRLEGRHVTSLLSLD